MGYNFKDYNPIQLLLLPPSLDDWLERNHLTVKRHQKLTPLRHQM